jgi:hypothetical protein
MVHLLLPHAADSHCGGRGPRGPTVADALFWLCSLKFRQRLCHFIAGIVRGTTTLCSHDGMGSAADESAGWSPDAHELTRTVGR